MGSGVALFLTLTAIVSVSVTAAVLNQHHRFPLSSKHGKESDDTADQTKESATADKTKDSDDEDEDSAEKYKHKVSGEKDKTKGSDKKDKHKESDKEDKHKGSDKKDKHTGSDKKDKHKESTKKTGEVKKKKVTTTEAGPILVQKVTVNDASNMTTTTEKDSTSGLLWLYILAAVLGTLVIAALVAILVCCLVKKRKTQAEEEEAEEEEEPVSEETQYTSDGRSVVEKTQRSDKVRFQVPSDKDYAGGGGRKAVRVKTTVAWKKPKKASPSKRGYEEKQETVETGEEEEEEESKPESMKTEPTGFITEPVVIVEKIPMILNPPKAFFSHGMGGGKNTMQRSKHLLTNHTKDKTYAVKTKCSNNRLFRVDPVYAIVPPGQSRPITVFRLNNNPMKVAEKVVLAYTEIDPAVVHKVAIPLVPKIFLASRVEDICNIELVLDKGV